MSNLFFTIQKLKIMLKKLPLTLAAAVVAFASYGQTLVPTTPQNKSVVLEEFTGIYCTYCPDGHARAQAIQDANPDRVSLINIHEGGFSVPSGNAPDFRTNFGTAIVAQSYSGSGFGYPAGTVNRHVFPGRSMASGGGTAMGRGEWAVSATEILAMPSNVNMGVEATLDIQTRVLTIYVEAYYTGNSAASTNLLNVALLQNNTKGPQTGGGMGNNYNHMHRLVHLITGQWGEVINTVSTGDLVTKTYTYTIPADYRGIEAVLEDMEIVAFLTESQQEVPTGSRAYPSFTGITKTNDASVRSIEPIEPTCDGNIAPVINIKNEGQETLTNLAITYEINGESQIYNWTGNLPALNNEDVELPAVSTTLQTTNTISVSIPSDEDNSNNTQSLSFDKAAEGTGSLTLEIRTDNWGYEFSWKLLNSAGQTVHTGNGYPNNATTNVDVDVSADCYTLVINDSWGDGGTRVTVKDHEGIQLFYATGNWGAERRGEFSSTGVLSANYNEMGSINIYPNPTRDILNITNAQNAEVQVFDILGKMILSKKDLSLNDQINVSNLNAGAYFLKISKDGNVTTKKFLVN